MDISIFSFEDYRDYLNALCGPKRKKSGMRAAIARAASSFNSYISKVLNHEGHITLEQAEDISRFLNHTEAEKKFFFLLVQKGRAGSHTLQKYFENEVDTIRKERLVLANQLKSDKKISQLIEAQYYSNWLFTAIDVALSVPQLRTKEALAQYLNIPIAKVTQILEFLTSSGLVLLENGKYVSASQHIHLDHNSPNINKHHINWRLRAMQHLETAIDVDSDVHYSLALTLSKKDVQKLKAIVVDFIKNVNELVDPSPPEEVCSLNMDFFRLGKLQ